MNQYRGPCTGKTEIYMLCDKVQKGKRKFYLWHSVEETVAQEAGRVVHLSQVWWFELKCNLTVSQKKKQTFCSWVICCLVFLINLALCGHLSSDDIEIIFRRGKWKASGEFAQTDVHRQIAIVFKTPPYQDQDISDEVEVSVALRRLSDQMESEPVNFTYLPHNPGQSELCSTELCRLQGDDGSIDLKQLKSTLKKNNGEVN